MARGLKLAGFRFKPFSRKQKQVLTWWLPESGVAHMEGIIGDGAIRSGKTVCMALAFVQWSMESFNGQNFGMAGKTVGSFRRNVLSVLKQMLMSRGYECADRRSDNLVVITRGDVTNYYYIFGGKDEGSQDLIQGITLAGLLLDEVALMPESFVNQATGRCSVEGSKFWFNCNPAGPEHWFKKQWIDKVKEKKMLYLHFTMEQLLETSLEQVEQLMTQTAEVGYRFDLDRFPHVNAVAFAENTVVQDFVSTAVEMAREDLTNMVQTLGFVGVDGKVLPLTQAYEQACDLAFQKVASGAQDYTSAIREATKGLAAKGIRTIDYTSGRHRSLEAAVRGNVMGAMGIMQEKISQQLHT